MRSSKSKAMDQVKQWCGSMKDEDNDRTYLGIHNLIKSLLNISYLVLLMYIIYKI